MDIDESKLSLMQRVALLPQDEQDAMFADFGEEDWASLENDWSAWARPDQLITDEPYYPIRLYLTGRGWGKAVQVDTPIFTAQGWKKMGEITEGDLVFDEQGKPCTVLQAHAPYYTDDVYRLDFSDRTSIVADGQHQWVTMDRGARKCFNRSILKTKSGIPDDWINWRALDRHGNSRYNHAEIRTTHEILSTLTAGVRGDRNHSIPTANALQMPKRDFLVDPYLLGMWLGDGYSAVGAICGNDPDIHSAKRYVEELGFSTSDLRQSGESNCYSFTAYGLTTKLRALGLLRNKHFPEEYLQGSEDQRAALLAGLLDTDGHMSSTGIVEFCSTIPSVAQGVMDLARSLGQQPRLITRAAVGRHKVAYRVKFRITRTDLFRYPRKVAAIPELGDRAQASRHQHRMITDVVPVPGTWVRCLTVSSPNSMYLVGEAMVPTHNTRAASEWIRQQVKNHPGCRIAVCGRTAKDVRDVMVLGESGIIAVCPPGEEPVYRPSESRLVWPQYEDAQVYLFSAESPESSRGNQFHYYLLDEYASHTPFRGPEGATAAENIMIATRLGDKPYGVITTTPRRVKSLRDLVTRAEEKGDVLIVKGSTFENTSLSSTYIDTVKFGKDPRLIRQELHGDMLDSDPEGALWTQDLIDSYRDASLTPPAGAQLRIIAVDPSVGNGSDKNDECGIVVIGATKGRDLLKRHAYVLEDASFKAPPEEWVKKVVELYKKWGAGAVVVETNQGRQLLELAIKNVDSSVRVVGVNASQGKKLRADPVTVPYVRGHVHHWLGADLATLELQMTSWEPLVDKKSPDRVDALVHGLTALLLDPPKGLFTGPITASTSARRRLPSGGRGTGRTWRDGTSK